MLFFKPLRNRKCLKFGIFCLIFLLLKYILITKQIPSFDSTFHIIDKFDSWKTIQKGRLFAFSAYFEHRRPWHPAVRIIGVRHRNTSSFHKVLVVYNASYIILVKCKSELIHENWKMLFSACFIICKLPHQDIPIKVSIQTSITKNIINFLPVHNYFYSPLPNNFAVCVKPLHYHYNDYMTFVEFIEFHRIFGISHFVFYNHTVGKQLDQILRMYISENLITVLPWQLDVISQKEIRTEGMFAALNDCLYRLMPFYKYLIMVDIDEIIIPRTVKSYQELVKKFSNSYGAFLVKNVFFYKEWEDDKNLKIEVEANQIPYLVTLMKTRRLARAHVWRNRSKYIVVSTRAVEVGNHFVWRFISGFKQMSIPEKDALLHHYRICERGDKSCLNKTSIIDTETHKYKNTLIKKVTEKLNLLKYNNI